VLAGRIWVLATGLALLAILVALQLYLNARYRRIVNPGLALATVFALVLVTATVGLLNAQGEHLRKAKHDGFDSVLSLSRARAISNSAHTDESRFLLDPDRADAYEQVYFDKSESILYVAADGVDEYYGGLDQAVAAAGRRNIPFFSFYGTEARDLDGTGPTWSAFRTVLSTYQQVQHDDQRIRQLVRAGTSQAATAALLGEARSDYDRYDRALVSLTSLHRQTFDGAIRAADRGLRRWNVLLPAGAAIIILLILAGVWPRLSEYR
jgi:hypothetical protein